MTDGSKHEPADWSSRHLWQIKAVQDVFWIGLAIALVWFGYHLRSVFVPILIGLALAYVLDPLVTFAENRLRLPRPATIGILFAGLAALTIGILALLIPVLVAEVRQLANSAPVYIATIGTRLEANVDDELVVALNSASKSLPASGAQLAKFALRNTGTALGMVSDVISTTVYVIVSLCLIPVYCFFFAWNFNSLVNRLQKLIPAAHRDRVCEIAKLMDSAVGNFLRGRLLVMAAMMVMFSIAFWIAGVPYWLLLGSLTGVLSFVPYLAAVGWLAAMASCWIEAATTSGESVRWLAIFVWPTVAYFAVQMLEGWLLTPWIQSKSMKMSAVTILIVVLLGGAIGGLYGLLLALPLAACARIWCDEVLLPKLEAWAQDA